MSESPNPPSPSWVLTLRKLLPALIFGLTLGFAWAGIRWGLPSDLHHQSYHPDEEVIWRVSQQIEPTKGDFLPGFYNYGTLYLSVLRVASDMAAVYGGVDEKAPWKHVGNAHLAGRAISSICFAGLATVIFLMLRRHISVFGAAIGAAMVGLAPGLMVHARFQTTDLMATFLLALGAYFALRLFDEAPPNPKLWALMGLFVGLSAGTKYTGVLGLFTILVAAWAAKRLEPKGIGIACGTMALGFLIGTPGVLLETSAFLRDFQYEMWHTKTGHGLIFEGINGFAFHLANLWQTLSPLAVGIAGIGVVIAAASKQKWIWALLAFAIPYFLLIGRAEVLFLRYTFPLVIVLAAGLGWLVSECHQRGGIYRIGVVAAILSVAQAAQVSGQFTAFMTSRDPRDSAVDYLRSVAKPGDRVGLVSDPWFWSPPFFPDSTVSRMPTGGMPGAMYALMKMQEPGPPPQAVRYLPPNPDERFDWDVRLLTETQPEYVIFSAFEVGPVARLSARDNLVDIPKLLVDRFKQFHEELEKRYEPVGTPSTGPLWQRYRAAYGLTEDLMYVRPDLWLWKKKQ